MERNIGLQDYIVGLFYMLNAKLDPQSQSFYYIEIPGIVDQNRNPVKIKIVKSSPFAGVTDLNKKVPGSYFTISHSQEVTGESEFNLKNYEEIFYSDGDKRGTKIQLMGDPSLITISLSVETRSYFEAERAMIYLKQKLSPHGGSFYIPVGGESKEFFTFSMSHGSHSINESALNMVTKNQITQYELSIRGPLDYQEIYENDLLKIDQINIDVSRRLS